MKNIYIIGAGGFGREVAWLIERINEESQKTGKDLTWNIKGFIDDNETILGKQEDNYYVVGNCEYLMKKSEEIEVYAVCAIGSAKIRKSVIDKLKKSRVKFATVIDPSVILSDRVQIGEGTIICAGTIITVDIRIGDHVIINLDCTLGHDDIIHDYVTIYPSVNVSGNVEVGQCSELGTGMQIIQGKNIGTESIIGAGAVVIRDIPDRCTAVGSPAKLIKFWK